MNESESGLCFSSSTLCLSGKHTSLYGRPYLIVNWVEESKLFGYHKSSGIKSGVSLYSSSTVLRTRTRCAAHFNSSFLKSEKMRVMVNYEKFYYIRIGVWNFTLCRTEPFYCTLYFSALSVEINTLMGIG